MVKRSCFITLRALSHVDHWVQRTYHLSCVWRWRRDRTTGQPRMRSLLRTPRNNFQRKFQNPTITVRVLAAERTFWEKATILHAWFHAKPDKRLRDHQSRHYYDLVKLYEAGIGARALQRLDLLAAVAAHKAIFFADPSAKYDEAKPGGLCLVPPASRHAELREDYGKMQEMIFGEPPSFDHLLAVLAEIQRQINENAQA